MLAIISSTLKTEPHSQFTLIYGNRSSQSMMFRQALADLKDSYPTRLQVVNIFSQEDAGQRAAARAYRRRKTAGAGKTPHRL
ncbi:phenylacetate-CoA oxygenase/reductase, PaaK subunit [Leclercia adecarboxylata]|uniref:Phenylacetate-CoA oxygenase/reductase, PaaK subunit n=1 Tax=Leclercia adecarboxylata TaxID=83655 RepID=A0A4U9HWL0_9ENTR|nr:phenylacetate-CoA oxygenase/reductase, PaaK subunit [Leclercia adecarboxylata]